MKEKIFNFIDDNKDNIIRDLIDLISTPSITENFKDVGKALDVYINMAKKHDLQSYTSPNNLVGIIDIGSGDETVGVLVHIDVVPPGDISRWSVNPFKSILKHDFIWGRGAQDNKGPCIAVLYAILAIKSLGLDFKKRIRVIVGTKEESKWVDMDFYKQNYELPDYGFSPDGEFPITNKEKGYADVILTFKPCEEKGELEIIEMSGGDATNTIPNYAYASIKGDADIIKKHIENYRNSFLDSNIKVEYSDLTKIEYLGESCHSSSPEKGRNAITNLCSLLHGLPLGKSAFTGLIRFVNKYLHNDYYGSNLGFDSSQLYFNNEYIGKTVLSPTLLHSHATETYLNINMRTAYGTILENISQVFDKYSLEYDYFYQIDSYLEPLYIKRDLPFLKIMCENYEKVTNQECKFLLAGGTSYAKAMPNTVSFGPVFDKEEDYCHEPDERISVDNLVKCCKIYALTLANMVFSDEKLI